MKHRRRMIEKEKLRSVIDTQYYCKICPSMTPVSSIH